MSSPSDGRGVIFERPYIFDQSLADYDVTPDAERFVFLKNESPVRNSTHLEVILNWSDSLGRLLLPR